MTEKLKVVPGGSPKKIEMGVGDAILRLIHVEEMFAADISEMPDNLVEERRLIVEALNQFTLDLGFDCNNDGVPDDVSIFKETAETSCCRILPHTIREQARKGRSSATARTKPGTAQKKSPPEVRRLRHGLKKAPVAVAKAPEPMIPPTPVATPPVESVSEPILETVERRIFSGLKKAPQPA